MQSNTDGGSDDQQSPGEEEREFLIGDLAQEFGVSLRTLRFYEDRGMLSPRRDGMMRVYSKMDRKRLERILKGKQLGFTLAEIQEMLAPGDRGGPVIDLKLSLGKVDEQIAHLETQRSEIDSAIDELRATRKRLTA